MKFKLIWTWQVELWIHSNPGSSTKTKLWTLSNLSKKLNSKQLNSKPVQPEIGWTQAQIQKNWTLNPGSSTKIKPIHIPKSSKKPNLWTFNPTQSQTVQSNFPKWHLYLNFRTLWNAACAYAHSAPCVVCGLHHHCFNYLLLKSHVLLLLYST